MTEKTEKEIKNEIHHRARILEALIRINTGSVKYGLGMLRKEEVSSIDLRKWEDVTGVEVRGSIRNWVEGSKGLGKYFPKLSRLYDVLFAYNLLQEDPPKKRLIEFGLAALPENASRIREKIVWVDEHHRQSWKLAIIAFEYAGADELLYEVGERIHCAIFNDGRFSNDWLEITVRAFMSSVNPEKGLQLLARDLLANGYIERSLKMFEEVGGISEKVRVTITDIGHEQVRKGHISRGIRTLVLVDQSPDRDVVMEWAEHWLNKGEFSAAEYALSVLGKHPTREQAFRCALAGVKEDTYRWSDACEYIAKIDHKLIDNDCPD